MAMRNVVTLILGGGRGTRLFPLTKIRAKPAVPLAGKYRLIDIPLSNCINSGLNRVYVLTQFMSVSLNRHIRQTYRFDQFNGGFVEVLAAQQTMAKGTDWFEGTADAVRKNLLYWDQPGVDYVLILSGDQLYQMDYAQMIETHRNSGADVTIAALPVDRETAPALGIMRTDETGKVVGFLEKPKPEEIDMVAMDPKWIDQQGVDSQGRDCLASMGIYLFNRDLLVDVLTKTDYRDFGKEVFPAAFRTGHVQVHMFDGYWEDIGTIRAFYEANLGLARRDAPIDLTDADNVVYSRARFLAPSLFDGATVRGSLIADGCRICRGAVVENSIVGLRSIIGPDVTIRNSIVMGADFYERQRDVRDDVAHGRPPVGIGANSIIEGAIIDKNCHIGQNVRIVNDQGIEATEEEGGVQIVDGIPCVVKNAVLPDGWKIG